MEHLAALSHAWTYGAILVAAIVEGEIAYLAASALVAQGQLNPVAVVVAGAIGASLGDQAFFYVFRGRLPRWLARFPSLELKARPLVARVSRHQSLMVLLIRFAPGLRIAITAACAWIDVPPLLFSTLNLLSAFAWAVVLLVLVGWAGPTVLAQYGLSGWRGAAVTGLLVFGLFKLLGMYEQRTMKEGT